MERNRLPRHPRGISLVLLAISLVVLMGMAALAIDLGMLQKTRAEAQRAADAAALAGASAYLLDWSVAAETVEAGRRARQVADTNYMAGAKIDSLTELTVWSIPDSFKVRVLVRRAAVPVWFARVFGRSAMAVGARAAAIADSAGGVKCVKPIAIPDLWDDVLDDNGPGADKGDNEPDPGETWLWEPGEGDTYSRADPNTGTGTGYGSSARDGTGTSRDWGRRIVLQDKGNMGENPCLDNQGNKCLMPGWWGLWDPIGGGKLGNAEQALSTCIDSVALIGSTYPTIPGQKNSLKKVLNQLLTDGTVGDPTAVWKATLIDPVTGKAGAVQSQKYPLANWRASPRVWAMGVFDPAKAPTKANANLQFNNFLLFFFEGCEDQTTGTMTNDCKPGTNLVGRYVGLAPGTGPGTGTLTWLLRLVE